MPKSFTARVVANFGEAVVVAPVTSDAADDDLADAELLRALPLKRIPLLVAGDLVTCDHGVRHDSSALENSSQRLQTLRITGLLKRSSELSRPDRRGKLKPLAANLTQLLITCAPKPPPDPLLIDQFCIAACYNGIEPILVLNKLDMLDDNASSPIESAVKSDIEQLMAAYQAAGFKTLQMSCKSGDGFALLDQTLLNQTSVLVGQSGVGKSSIIQHILPDQDIRTGKISAATGLGSHTTTVSFYYELPNQPAQKSSALIDSPGVRQFSVEYLDATQIISGYPEISELSQDCRFHNCRHLNEPDCAVQEALDAKQLSTMRYASYRKLSEAQSNR